MMKFTVFIDTNIYQSSNFSFYSSKFDKLKELIYGKKVKLLYNKVIYCEVKQHIGEYIRDAVMEYNAAINNKGFAPFRFNPRWKNQLEKLDEKLLVKEQLENWDIYLSKCDAEEIPVDCVNVEVVLEKYFNKQLPFENKKPTEFKDAITIESIKCYFASHKDEELFVVSADKGFRKSFRDSNITTFDSLNKFLNYVIIQSGSAVKFLAEKIEKEDFSDYIRENIYEIICVDNIDLGGWIDDLDIETIEFDSYRIGYIDVLEDRSVEVTLEIDATIDIIYIETDEENSYYDREDGRYLWEEFVTVNDSHKIIFDAILRVDVCGLDEENIKSTVEKCGDKLHGLDDIPLEFDIIIEDMYLPNGAIIALDDRTLVESKIIARTIDENCYDEYDSEAYTFCPDCGKPISNENDGGNGFCVNCAPDH